MIATIIKIKKQSSRYGGHFFYAFFKGINDRSYYSCLYPKMRNWARWKKVLKEGVTLKGLKLKGQKLIDADSRFVVLKG